MLDLLMPAVCGLVAILGHVFPLYLKLRGGRGVATGVGVVAAIDWRVAAIAVGAWIVFVLLTRYIAVASVLASIAVPAAFFALGGRELPYLILFLLAPLVVALRHIPNFKRLKAGTEHRLWKNSGHSRDE